MKGGSREGGGGGRLKEWRTNKYLFLKKGVLIREGAANLRGRNFYLQYYVRLNYLILQI